ncbi:MAG: hypothetical protein JNN30_17960 [Rhodanobacteraceae bacterium]|nr:hypothetical protein [Rhodanobacteraceae bacterium]
MVNSLKNWILGSFIALLSASPVLAGAELASETTGQGTSRVNGAGQTPSYGLDLVSQGERPVSHYVDSSGAVNIVKRGPREPDVPAVVSATDEREAAIKSKALRDSAHDPIVRSIIEQRYGKEALAIAETNPRLIEMFNGEYSEEAILTALNLGSRNLYGRPLSHFASKSAIVDHGDLSETILQQMRDYAPVYYFHSKYDRDEEGQSFCFPIEWKPQDKERCRPSIPAHVPVYPSVTFRPNEQGGGTYSYWINFHVFYGWQQGWIGGAHGDDWETTSIHFVNNSPVAVKYRVHGGAVTIYPWNSTPRDGNRHRVYVGTYFHGHYPTNYCRFGFDNLFGEFYKTWWDCRGDGTVIQPQIYECVFADGSENGDACNNFSRNLFDEPRHSSKSEPDPKSSPPRGNFNVPANLTNGINQICYSSETGWEGIADCAVEDVPKIGRTMNDVVSNIRYFSHRRSGWKLFEHENYQGSWCYPGTWADDPDCENDSLSSIQKQW